LDYQLQDDNIDKEVTCSPINTLTTVAMSWTTKHDTIRSIDEHCNPPMYAAYCPYSRWHP